MGRMLGLLLDKRFQLTSELGQGGMGTVYGGVDTETSQLVAIKHLRPETVASRHDMVSRFAQEAEALRNLNHPNIVKVLATIQENDQHYLVMEYVDGGSLHELLEEEKRLSVARTLEIALDLADALTRAHRLNIIHRDIKPSNVLLAADGTPRLSDFGVARVEQSQGLTQTGDLIGTIDYLSPEACQGKPLDARADIWAFGVLLFEMLTGERPFTRPNIAATLTAILNDPVPDLAALLPIMPPNLVDLIYRMLIKDRETRLASVRLVGAEIEALMQHSVPAMGDSPKINTLLQTKLYIPPPRSSLVTRPRLIDQLNAGLESKLILVSAPAGFGKTTLVSEWVAGCERPVAWLSLDESDNDPIRFLVYFVATLQTTQPDVGETAVSHLHSPQPHPGIGRLPPSHQYGRSRGHRISRGEHASIPARGHHHPRRPAAAASPLASARADE
jgi:serine/threonine protein kinase